MGVGSAAWAAQPADRAELQALRAQVQQLESQVKELARRLEEKERAPAPAATAVAPTVVVPAAAVPAPATVSVTDRGYSLASAEADNSIRLRGLLQVDSRTFVDHDPAVQNGGFLLRRARLISDGVLARHYSFLFAAEFAGSSVSILDAALTLRFSDDFYLKAGKFKTPIGLEVLQPDGATAMTERSMLSAFLPGRDLGVLVGGTSGGGRIDYTFGVVNGVADGTTSSNTDFDNTRDLVGRVTVMPFRGVRASPLRALTLGVGGSAGRQRTAAGRTAGYRTDGQQMFFSYLPGVTAAGDVWRVSPQLDYRLGPFGLLAEYALSNAELQAPSGRRRALRHDGWQVTTSYVLTGEDSSYNQVTPRRDFDPAAGNWGAVEMVARYASVDLDGDAFPEFAAPEASATSAESGAVGLKWYLSKAVALKLNYYQTHFGLEGATPFASPAPLLRRDEKAVVTRLQIGF